MKWITREKVKVDRLACLWLIRKLVDPLYPERKWRMNEPTR